MENDQQFGELKATLRYVADTVVSMTNTVEKNNEVAADFREHVVGELSTIKEKLIAFSEYKSKCEADRDALDKRTSQIEAWKERQAGKIYGGVAASVFFGSLIGWIISNINTLKGIMR